MVDTLIKLARPLIAHIRSDESARHAFERWHFEMCLRVEVVHSISQLPRDRVGNQSRAGFLSAIAQTASSFSQLVSPSSQDAPG